MVDYKNASKDEMKNELTRLSRIVNYKPTMGVADVFSNLPPFLATGEKPLCVCGGFVKTSIWLIIPTNKRIIFLHKIPRFFSKKCEISIVNYENVVSIDSSSGLVGGQISVNVSGLSYCVSRLQRDSVSPTVLILEDQKAELKQIRTAPQPHVSEPDIYTRLEKLGDLKAKGILSDDEFQKEKQKLLA